jgi:hypothetical protein
MSIEQALLILFSTLSITGSIHTYDNKLIRKIRRYLSAELDMLKFEEKHTYNLQLEKEKELLNTYHGKVYKNLDQTSDACDILYPSPEQYELHSNTCKQLQQTIRELQKDALKELINDEHKKYHNDYRPVRENKIKITMKYNAALRMSSAINRLIESIENNQLQTIVSEEMLLKIINNKIDESLNEEDTKAYQEDLAFSMDRSEIRDSAKKELQELAKNLLTKEGRETIKTSILSRAQQHEPLKNIKWK